MDVGGAGVAVALGGVAVAAAGVGVAEPSTVVAGVGVSEGVAAGVGVSAGVGVALAAAVSALVGSTGPPFRRISKWTNRPLVPNTVSPAVTRAPVCTAVEASWA